MDVNLKTDGEKTEYLKNTLAQALGWGDFSKCSPAQTEWFAEAAKLVGLDHLGNPRIRAEMFLSDVDTRVQRLRSALAAYRSALRCGERESDQLRDLGDAALEDNL